jgi:hypothetical protein
MSVCVRVFLVLEEWTVVDCMGCRIAVGWDMRGDGLSCSGGMIAEVFSSPHGASLSITRLARIREASSGFLDGECGVRESV